jgi:Zn finger protein HypA/HybF involved in hydrogenase expression
MIIINVKVTILKNPVYAANCPECNEQFLAYLYPKYMCPHCCASIPDILGIVNASTIKLRYYFSKAVKGTLPF